MTPTEELLASIPDEPCDCRYYVEILNAKSGLRQADAYHTLTVFCGVCLCLMVMSFFAFLMLAAWYERKTSVDTLIVGTIFGLFSTMVGMVFGISKKQKLTDAVKTLTQKGD